MKFLFVHRGPYLRAHGGGTRADRFLMRTLVQAGHECTCLVSVPIPEPGASLEPRLVDGIATQFHPEPKTREGIRLTAISRALTDVATTHRPDCIVITGTDKASLLVRAALAAAPRVVRLVRSTAELGFGPSAVVIDDQSITTLARCSTVLCGSEYMSNYIETWAGIRATPLLLRNFPEPRVLPEARTRPFVTLVNPSAIKGIDIFLGLAERLPHVSFAAVPTWATTQAERARLAGLANVTVLQACDDIDDIFAKTRILLMPSLCDEAFGTVIVEAMMRGIPVIASNIGGIPEAMLGNPSLVDVQALTGYAGSSPENGAPLAIVPPQDLTGWMRALTELLQDATSFERIAETARGSALAYARRVSAIDPVPIILGD